MEDCNSNRKKYNGVRLGDTITVMDAPGTYEVIGYGDHGTLHVKNQKTYELKIVNSVKCFLETPVKDEEKK